MQNNDSLDVLRVKLDSAEVKNGVSNPTARALLQKELSTGETIGHVGWISLAAALADGTFQVQVDVPGVNAWSSTWPKWAYDVAVSAMLHGKAILVVSNGIPWGRNLVLVSLLNR